MLFLLSGLAAKEEEMVNDLQLYCQIHNRLSRIQDNYIKYSRTID